MVKEIPLTQGKTALVDDEDYDYLMQWKWHYYKGYARRNKKTEEVSDGKPRSIILMHREINKTPKEEYTDHINGNRGDNRRCNLRNCSAAENRKNSSSYKDSSSKYKGVSWNEKRKKWVSRIFILGEDKYLGGFKTENEAAHAYNLMARLHFKEFAKLNFIDLDDSSH